MAKSSTALVDFTTRLSEVEILRAYAAQKEAETEHARVQELGKDRRRLEMELMGVESNGMLLAANGPAGTSKQHQRRDQGQKDAHLSHRHGKRIYH